MKKIKFNIIKSISIIILMSQVLIACKTDEVELITPPDRLFAPALFGGTVIENNISLSWTPISNSSYLLELSKDSLQFTTDLVVIPLDDVSYYTFSNLWSRTRYSARIKAVSKDPKLKDSKCLEITFKTATENIFYNIATTDILSDQVMLKWSNWKNVNKIVYYIEGNEDPAQNITITLTAEEIAEGAKNIVNLLSATTYYFEIYYGEMLRGTTYATTL